MNGRTQDQLIRHGVLLIAATQVANVSNLLFQIVMGRALSAEQYGVLVSMLGIVVVVTTPVDAVRTAMAHYAARLEAEGRRPEISGLLKQWLGFITALAVPLLLVMAAFSRPLADFFRIETRVPVVLTGLILAGSFYLPLFVGALQGVQAFVWMAVAQHSWSLARLLAGASLVFWIGRRAEFGLAGQVAGVLVSGALGLAGLKAVVGLARSAPGARVRGVPRYVGWSLLILGGFAVLMNADVIMVKRFFPPFEAGLFARAATIGRSVVFISMPIALAMFPKVASGGEVREGSRAILLKAFLFAAGIILAAAALVSAWPELPLLVLFRDRAPSADMIRLVRQVIWAMSPLGLVYLAVHFELAQHRFRQAIALIGCAAGYVTAVVMKHATYQQVVTALAVASGLAALLLLAGLPWRGFRSGQEESWS